MAQVGGDELVRAVEVDVILDAEGEQTGDLGDEAGDVVLGGKDGGSDVDGVGDEGVHGAEVVEEGVKGPVEGEEVEWKLGKDGVFDLNSNR